jgi:hypothetical protein
MIQDKQCLSLDMVIAAWRIYRTDDFDRSDAARDGVDT